MYHNIHHRWANWIYSVTFSKVNNNLTTVFMCDVSQCPSAVWQSGSSLRSNRAERSALIPSSSPSVSLYSAPLLSVQISVNKPLTQVDGKLLMEPPDAMQTVYP